MIRVKELCKSFDGVHALDGMNMHVRTGSIYGLVGPNGSGKTTLLQHVAGVMRPNSGEVRVNGEPVFENLDVKSRIAYVPSSLYFYRQARVRDMRDLYLRVWPGFDATRFDALVQSFDLDDTRMVRSLSKGMQKQLAFCLSLAQQPQVLLLDEPLDGLDPLARRSVLGEVMDAVAENNLTVLVSSHNLRELADVCDCVGIVEAGRMRIERNLEELEGSFVKVQVAFATGIAPQFKGFEVLHAEQQGKLHTLVVRGDAGRIEAELAQQGATFVNLLPLSLEEIFVYELGGEHREG